MNVIFLDFNGVLDTNEKMDEINIDNLKRLKRIVEETASKVVISSSKKNGYWRTGKISTSLQEILDALQNEGIEVIGFTPYLDERELEIKTYLENHPEIDNFCIIDDDYYMESFKDNLVKLPNQIEKGQKGLDEFHTEASIKILKKQITN